MQNIRTPLQNDSPFFSSFFSPGSPANTSDSKAHNVLQKDRDRSIDGRRPSFNRKASYGSPKSTSKRRASSVASTINGAGGPGSGGRVVTDDAIPPALPLDFALLAKQPSRTAPTAPPGGAGPAGGDTDLGITSPASIDSFSKMLARTTSNTTMNPSPLAPSAIASAVQPSETSAYLYQHIQDTANKRISTLDYLRKTHEGKVYWFNTLLFDKPDLARMPHFDARRLARRATNYLLLGLSLPAVIDLNSSTPVEFLRSLNTLLSEFDTFQTLHPETGSAQISSLSRAARLPQMFRRATTRRTSSSAAADFDPPPAGGGGGGGGGGMDDLDFGPVASHNPGAGGGGIHSSSGGGSVISFAHSEHNADLLPGEEYTHLLTPSLPFDPDFFETFTTLCDVLIECYARLLNLLAAPNLCTAAVGELFTKADSKVRKIIIQGVVKEFEDSSRQGIKMEIASVGKVVLGGLI